MKKRIIKIGLFIAIVFLFTQLFYGSVTAKADTTVVDNYISLSKTVTNTKGETGTDITAAGGERLAISYAVTSKNIPKDNINVTAKKKKVILVVDTSGSMRIKDMAHNHSRAETVKNAAKKFIAKTAGKDADIAVVPYSASAEAYSNEIQDFTNSISQLDSYIDGMTIYGGTNIGDGMRKAYYMLKDIDSSAYDKYIVLLTDGQPNEWSVNNDKSYYTGGYDAPYVLGEDNYDSTGDGLKYADKIGDIIAGTDINTYMIAFTRDTDISKMKDMAGHAKAQLSSARDEDGLNDVYDEISNQILNSFTVTSVNFREEFPANVTILDVPPGFIVDNDKHIVTGELTNLSYTLDGDVYKLSNQLDFTIDIKFDDKISGKYSLSPVSELFYTDYNKHSNKADFNTVNIKVSSAKEKISNAPIEFLRIIDKDEFALQDGSTEDIKIEYSIIPKKIDFYSVDTDFYFNNMKNTTSNVVKELPVSDGIYTATIPAGLRIKSIQYNGMEFSKNKYKVMSDSAGNSVITFDLDDMGGINYKLDDSKEFFKADPINFDIVLKGTETGTYILHKENTYLTYKDIKYQTTKLYTDKALKIVVYQSRVRQHGLYTNNDNTIGDSNFVFSIGGQPIDTSKENSYTAAVVADITGADSLLNINIGAGTQRYNSSDIKVNVFKIKDDGSSFNDKVNYNNAAVIKFNSDNSTDINVKFHDKGTYIAIYTFKMDVDEEKTLTNTASIGSSRQDLILREVKEIPDLF
ncbi:vWA domain-containing protein [Clostridium oryzae]|uniref:von Willebrand factor type A domain protein n=1 Tax=Clostridium oryzae TaxID=1450648 RepID=A0A1V4IN84_9CLOT|nr:vWA domain-containing protein [Clostridium oryzae]OPJ61512.1 von Willebrand factor type A domain protein [Clostridium oryzae]